MNLPASHPRIGIPWRTSAEQTANNRPKLANYENAVRDSGAEPVVLPLNDPSALREALSTLDGFVLPGSPADVSVTEYGAQDLGLSAEADRPREVTDRAILDHAFAEKKPVLAICYGCQLLNVYRGGTLIQDLWKETGTRTPHRDTDIAPDHKGDAWHGAEFEPNSRLAALAQSLRAPINSSHHQAIARPGKDLRVTAHAPEDGTIEAVEWTGQDNWIVGVQWHPERMHDEFTKQLFDDFVAAARNAKVVQQAR